MERKVLISGGSGFIGNALSIFLSSHGYQPYLLVRREPQHERELYWDPYSKKINLEQLEGFNTVINLSGASIAGWWWTIKRKRILTESRLIPARFLVESLTKLRRKPNLLISASGAGFYGDRGSDVVDESANAGAGFLSDLAELWERESYKVQSEFRVITLRLGMVISRSGGALKAMLLPFKLGLGGRLGSGRQYLSWIYLKDLLRLFLFCVENERIVGPVNATAPNAITNLEFTKTIGEVLRRPTIFPVPGFIVNLLFGELGRELLLASTNAVPAKALANGFEFQFGSFEGALRDEFPKI